MDIRDVDTKGARLGRYVIDAWLASGGMSDVYRARAHGAAGIVKELAIKRVSGSALESDHAVERFVAEARLSMQLSHANIVSVFDFGRADDGYYLAMEWIDGIDLAALVGRVDDPAPLPLGVVAYVGGEVARALQHAHEQRSGAIVHRDVKPSNVLLSRSGDVKLGDFGIAITVGTERTIAGTRGYMAPEQARGEPVDARADLFGLGKILLETAIGFRVEDTDVPHGLARLDAELAQIVRPMLAPEVADRASSAKSVASALERFASTTHARGGEAPRDQLAAIVTRACAIRTPMRASLQRLERLQSFALTETAEAIDVASAESTRAARPKAIEERTPVAPSAPSPRRSRLWVLPAAAVFLASLFALRATQERQAERRAGASSPRAPVTARPSPTSTPVVAPPPTPPTVPVTPQRVSEVATPTPAPITPRRAAPRETERAPLAARDPAPAPPQAVGSGILSIAARPWANVFVDGRAVGTTPILGLSLPAGSHRVRLENDALGVTRSLITDVPADGRRNLTVDLQ